jgi:hypothetical protein
MGPGERGAPCIERIFWQRPKNLNDNLNASESSPSLRVMIFFRRCSASGSRRVSQGKAPAFAAPVRCPVFFLALQTLKSQSHRVTLSFKVSRWGMHGRERAQNGTQSGAHNCPPPNCVHDYTPPPYGHSPPPSFAMDDKLRGKCQENAIKAIRCVSHAGLQPYETRPTPP